MHRAPLTKLVPKHHFQVLVDGRAVPVGIEHLAAGQRDRQRGAGQQTGDGQRHEQLEDRKAFRGAA